MNLKQIGIIMLAILFIYGCKNGENKQDDNDGETQKEMQPQSQPEQMDGPSQQNQTQAGEVSDEELEKFASVFLTQQELQQDMVQIIQNEGMSVQRFQQIQKASQNPEQELDASEEEMKQYKSVMASIQEAQPESQKKIQDKIKEEGLSEKRYSEINNEMRQNQELQKRFQTIMQKEQQAQPAQPMPE